MRSDFSLKLIKQVTRIPLCCADFFFVVIREIIIFCTEYVSVGLGSSADLSPSPGPNLNPSPSPGPNLNPSPSLNPNPSPNPSPNLNPTSPSPNLYPSPNPNPNPRYYFTLHVDAYVLIVVASSLCPNLSVSNLPTSCFPVQERNVIFVCSELVHQV